MSIRKCIVHKLNIEVRYNIIEGSYTLPSIPSLIQIKWMYYSGRKAVVDICNTEEE